MTDEFAELVPEGSIEEFEEILDQEDAKNDPDTDVEEISEAGLKYEIEINTSDSDRTKAKTTRGLAAIIMNGNHFAQDDGGNLHVYKDGVYIPRAEQAIALGLQEIGDYFKVDIGRWRIAEVINYIKAKPNLLLASPNPNILNVANGLLYFFDGDFISFEPWDEKYRTTVQIAAHYDPEATCPTWDKLIADTFPKGSEDVAWEILAWLMMPITSIKKSILLHGHGNDGKSIFLKAIRLFLGNKNVSGLPLHELASRFSGSDLVGKLANIDTDLSEKDLVDSSMIKRITGGDSIRVEEKYQKSYVYEPFVRCVFSTNYFPKSQDKSRALQNRFIIIPFHNSFEENAKLKSRIERKLAEPEELAGALNKAIKALPRLLEDEFRSSTAKFAEVSKSIIESSDTLAQWLNDNTVEEALAYIECEDLMKAYNKAEPRDFERSSASAFGIAMKKLRPHIHRTRIMIEGKQRYCYMGLGLAEDELGTDEDFINFDLAELETVELNIEPDKL